MVNLKLLVSIGHPAHVHVFKHLVWDMEKRGHEIKIVARNKDISKKLLDVYDFDYTLVSDAKRGIGGLAIEMMVRVKRLLPIIRNFNPDIVLSLLDPSVAIATKMMRGKYISLHDTEHAKLVNATVPFTDVVLTPSCFKKDIGKKQVRYNGYHELAYLHPNYFTPNPAVLDELGVREEDTLILMRFVSFKASHDTKTKGFTQEMKERMVKEFEKYGQVFITSEGNLDHSLKKYQLRVSPEKLHSLLYYSNLYIGDGGTTAVEAALLGTPTVHCVSVVDGTKFLSAKDIHGNFCELEHVYHMLYSFSDEKESFKKAKELLESENFKDLWVKKREDLLRDKIDVTAFMVWFIENYPESINMMRDNPDIQNNFKR